MRTQLQVRRRVTEFVAKELNQPSLPYIGRLPDGQHVVGINRGRVLVRDLGAKLEMQVLRDPTGAPRQNGRR